MAAPSPATARLGGRLLVPVLILLELFGGVIQGWIIPLLGAIAAHYDVSGGSVSWVLTVGLLSSAVSVPLMVVIADRWGRKPVLVAAVTLTAAGSVLIALAPSFPVLLLGAVIQGPVAVWLPLEMALLKSLRPASAAKIIGSLVGCLTIGVAAGAVFGGMAMDAIGNLPLVQLIPAIGIVILVGAVGVLVPRDTGDPTRRVDWAGAGTLGIALIGIMFGLSEGAAAGWTSPQVLLPLAIGLLALTVFFIVESRAADPLVDVRVIRSGGLVAPLLIAFLVSVALFGNQTPSVLYLTASPDSVGYGAAVTAGAVGMLIGLSSLLSSAGAFVSALAARTLGVRTSVALGALLVAVGMGAMVALPRELGIVLLLSCVSAFGTGLVVGILPGVVVQRAPVTSAASVSGLYNTTRTLGGSLAGALVAAVLAAVILPGAGDGGPAVPSGAAFQIIWGVFAALNLVAAVLALTLRRPTAPAAPASIPTAEEVTV